ncbi:MAG: M3 family metallopeptidase [Solirubrobacteraceae bacterium]
MSLDFDVALEPELAAAMAEHRAEVEAIAAGNWPPTFDDTILALERAGQRLHLAESLFEDASGTRSTPDLRALEAEMLPRLAAHHDAVALDGPLFARIADLAQRREELGLDEEATAVLDRYHRDRVRSGAALPEDGQRRLREINERLAALTATFRANLHEETEALAVPVQSADELAGLPAPAIAAAARAADGEGYLLTLDLPAAQPALEDLHDRALRERVYRASVSRCRRGGPHDNRAVVSEIGALRAERAGLLGFDSHAEFEIDDQTAPDVAAVIELDTTVGGAGARAVSAEIERHGAALEADGHAGPLQPWDFPYYAARERRAEYAIDEAALRDWFVLDRVIEDGLFGLAADLYGLDFTPLPDHPRPHPDVLVWSVSDEDGGDRGLLFLDPYARPGKHGGAWMGTYQSPAPILGRPAHVLMVLNATRPADGTPATMTPLDVGILFHEFGHALHELLSDVAYPRIAGTNVAWDVVEFPSKFHEALAMRPELLERYARHVETGAPLPAEAVTALGEHDRATAAYHSTQASAGSLIDQAWHALAPGDAVPADDVDGFEQRVVEGHGLALQAVGLRYHSAFYAHIFDGGYDGTLYSYLWSATLEATALEWLDEQGGLSREAGRRLREAVLARGAVVEPLAALRSVTGRSPSAEALLRRRGLAPAA